MAPLPYTVWPSRKACTSYFSSADGGGSKWKSGRSTAFAASVIGTVGVAGSLSGTAAVTSTAPCAFGSGVVSVAALNESDDAKATGAISGAVSGAGLRRAAGFRDGVTG